ncbi:Inner membrane protein YbhL [anaerobic digester metagenome]
MEQNTNYSEPQVFTKEQAGVRNSFVAKVFSWMFAALIITAVVSFLFGSQESLIRLLYNESGMTILGWIVMFAPVGLVLLMSLGYNKLSATAMSVIFIIYAALMGASLGFIFLVYQLGTIGLAFIVTAGMFAIMAIAGYTTKMDLTKFGNILMIALVAIVIGSVVNMFMRNDTMDFIICIVGVLVFTGLIAYDMQRIKQNAEYAMANPEAGKKMAVFSALSLYLDFINLFLMLLRLFGRNE